MDAKAMFRIGYGLYVLSARDGEKDNACITNSVLQLTSDPLTVGVAVNKSNYTHDMIHKTHAFNLSVLPESTPFSVFTRFGFQSGRDADKFEGFTEGKRSGSGIYYYTAANARISGWVTQEIDLGTHTFFVAAVTDAEVLSAEPTASYTYYQQHIKPKPSQEKKSGWRCSVCGYIYEGEALPADFVCPICKHGAADFEKL